MRDLLFLAHRIPYPPNKGDKVRSWHLLRYLSNRYNLHLGCFIDDEADWQYATHLRERCGECCFLALSPARAKLRSMSGLYTGAPLTLCHYRDRAMAAWVDGLFAQRPVERVFVFSSAMAQYAIQGQRSGVRRIIDFVDVDSDKWRQYAARKRWPLNRIYARESHALRAFDVSVAATFDASLFVSQAEADVFCTFAPEIAHKVFTVRNGVDFEFFSPDRGYEDPFGGRPHVLVFTGAMDYWANVDGVAWFARQVLPLVRRRVPGAEFYIVGARPTAEVLRLARLPGVTVAGRVPDVRPYLAHAAAVVVPLRVARGVQNKVLEAMAMAKPIVATPQALEGIDARPDQEVLVGKHSEGFAQITASLLAERRRGTLGHKARAHVVKHHNWTAQLSSVEAILEGTGQRADMVSLA
jgi:sugar transferase (PEP-CTERM/EpsH1 system associated)